MITRACNTCVRPRDGTVKMKGNTKTHVQSSTYIFLFIYASTPSTRFAQIGQNANPARQKQRDQSLVYQTHNRDANFCIIILQSTIYNHWLNLCKHKQIIHVRIIVCIRIEVNFIRVYLDVMCVYGMRKYMAFWDVHGTVPSRDERSVLFFRFYVIDVYRIAMLSR